MMRALRDETAQHTFPIDVRHCYEGCQAENGNINHNKVFHAVRPNDRDWVIQSSANLGNRDSSWEQALYIDAEHYTDIGEFFSQKLADDLCKSQPIPSGNQDTVTPFDPTCPTTLGNGGFESVFDGTMGAIHLGPNSERHAILDWIANMGYEEGCEFQAAMGHLRPVFGARNYAEEIILALRELSARGCDVHVIFSDTAFAKTPDSYTPLFELANADAANGQAPITLEHQLEDGRVHAKFFTWNGEWNGSSDGIVWSGSANWYQTVLDLSLIHI